MISDSMIDDFLALISGEAELSRFDLGTNQYRSQPAKLLARTDQAAVEIRTSVSPDASHGVRRPAAYPKSNESMELYAKNSDRIECDVIAVPVSQFMDDVTEEPSNSTLRSLYNEGKSRYPDPTGEKPGFKIGRRLVAQYFVADFDTFQQNEMNKLTDAQVEAEYDRLVAEESDLVMEVIPQDVEDDVVTPDERG